LGVGFGIEEGNESVYEGLWLVEIFMPCPMHAFADERCEHVMGEVRVAEGEKAGPFCG
jgi:hypothetical protein